MPSHFTKGARKKQAQVKRGLAELRSVAKHHRKSSSIVSVKGLRFFSVGTGS
jgi:hypothetical protein